MSLLKIYRPQAGDTRDRKPGKWVDGYARNLMDRLRADKNLSDIEDRTKARENLELTGDNNMTHFHDSRYMPLIQEEATVRAREDAQLRDYVDQRIQALEKELRVAIEDIRSNL